MKAFRIAAYLLIGVVYIGYSMAHPDEKWMARGVAVAALIAVSLVVRLVAGKEVADSSPLEADPIPSLNLSQRSLDRDAADGESS